MASRNLKIIFWLCLLGGVICWVVLAQTPAPSPTATPPTGAIFPITNGRLMTPLDANQFPIQNGPAPTGPNDYATKNYVDTHSGGGGGGGGGGLSSITGDSGVATGMTLTITTNATNVLTDPVFTLGGTLSLAHGGTGATSAAGAKTNLSLNNVENTALSTWAGSANLTTLGTVATGTWNATAIAASKLPALNGITAPTADVSLNSFKITSLANPTNATDASNKQYVDAVATGGVPHPAVAVASIANIPSLSGEQTIDGVTTSASRVLVKDQTTQTANGIYVTASGAWTRATDADVGSEIPGSVFVSGGTVNAGTTWASTSTGITIGSTNIVYTQTGASTIYSAGTGLSLTGSQFSLANMAPFTVKGNKTSGTATPTDLTATDLKGANMLNIANVENTALSTWAGSSNLTTLGTIATGTVPIARVSPTPSTAGQSLFQLANPNTIAFPRILANNTADTRTPAQLIGDIGAVPTGRTLTTTAPLRISTSTTPISGAPGSDWSANRTIDEPFATSGQDGYLKKEDFAFFSSGGITSVTLTGGTTTLATGVNRVVLNLSSAQIINLPSAAGYSSGQFIELVDVNGGTVGNAVTITAASGQSINGLPSITMPSGFTYSRINANTATQWRTTDYYSTTVRDFNDATKQFTFDASAQAGSNPGPQVIGNVKAARGNSVTVIPSDQFLQPGRVSDVNSDGSVSKSPVTPSELAPVVDLIGTLGSPNPDAGPHTVPTNGSVDTVIIAGTLSAPYTINWPPAASYAQGETLTLVDQSGSVSQSVPVTLAASGSDTFPLAATTYTVDEPYSRKVFTSDGASPGHWTIGETKTSVQPFTYSTGNNGVFTIDGSRAAVKHNAYFKLQSGQNYLKVNNPYDGMTMEFYLEQPSTGGQGFLNLPRVSAVGNNGLGLITLSSTNGYVDRLRGNYNGYLQQFMWEPVSADSKQFTTGALPSGSPSALATTSVGAYSVGLQWTDNSNNEAGFSVQRADGINQTTGFVEVTTAGPSSPASATGGTITATDPGIQPSPHQYTYQVLATNAAGSSGASNRINVSAASGAPTADNWEIHFVTTDTGGTNATATKPAGGSATLDQAEWATTGLASPSTAAWAPGRPMTTPSVTVSYPGATGSTPVTYYVQAFRTGGVLHSARATVTSNTTPLALNSTDKVHLSWPAVAAANYYEVYRGTSWGAGPYPIGRIGTNITGSGTITFDDIGQGTDSSSTGSTSNNDVRKVTANASIDYGTTNVLAYSFWAKSTWTNSEQANATYSAVLSKDTGSVQGALLTGTFTAAPTGPRLEVTFTGTTGDATGYVPLHVQRTGPSGSSSFVDSGTDWHHFVVIMDNRGAVFATTDIKVYIDKTNSGAGQTGETVTYLSTGQDRTGPKAFAAGVPHVGGNYFYGQVDDVRIFNHALTNTEIASLFDAGPQ